MKMKYLRGLIIAFLYLTICKNQSNCTKFHRFSLLGPLQSTLPPKEDVYQELIDLKNFTFLENPQACNNTKNLLLMVIIPSKWDHYDRRMAIRKVWREHVRKKWTKVLFLVGQSPEQEISDHDVAKESIEFRDIVKGNFIDTYRNLTYKHVMGLKWVAHHCPGAKYVLKIDDDIDLNPTLLRMFLVQRLSPWGSSGLIACYDIGDLRVPRSPSSKHYVTLEEYPHETFPPSCAGWVILYSQDVVQALLKPTQTVPYFWIDDVYVTGMCGAEIGVKKTDMDKLIYIWKKTFRQVMQSSKNLGSLPSDERIFGTGRKAP